MKSLLRFSLLGIFVAIGIGWAVIVGTGSTPVVNDTVGNNSPPPSKSSPELSHSEPMTAENPAKDDGKVKDIIPLSVTATVDSVVALPPPPPEFPKPIIVQPSPRNAQQYIPPPPPEIEATTSGAAPLPATTPVSGMVKFLQDRLTSPTQPAGNASATPIAGQGNKKSTINGEGDGKLRIHIYDEDIRKVLDLISEQGNLNILASKSVEGKVSATLNGVDIDSALDAILKSTGFVAKREGNYVFVGTPDDFSNLEQALDKIGTRIYQPNYITAVELKTLITPLLSEKIGILSVSTPAEAGIAVNDNGAGGNKFAGNEVVVVRDYEAVLMQIDQMVEEIDVRPLQVSIEAMILSVKLKDTDKFGVNFQFLRDNPNMKFGIGKPLDALASFKLDEGGLKFGFLDTSLGAFLNALETVGDTNVVANPRLMVLNKHQANIQIGENKGYLSSTVTETSTTYAVQFLELGTVLRLRPFVSSDGLIRMEIHPELSDGDVKLEGGYTLPNKTVTQVTTNVMVRDGCTVILGGLMRDQLVTNTTQVPFFGNLPIVGVAFRNTEETIERHEVLILITPRIVYEPGMNQEGAKGAAEYYRRHGTYADKMNPLGKRSVGRRYFRLAQSAWADGDQKKALRFAEMAVQFDPVNRAAIDLRSDIWLNKREGEHTQGAEQTGYAAPVQNPMDGQTVADWLIDDLECPVSRPPMPLHPYDRGQPGTHNDLERPEKLQSFDAQQ